MEQYHDTFQRGKYKGLIDTRVFKCCMTVNSHRNHRPCQYCRYIPVRPLPLRLEFKSTILEYQPTSPKSESATKNLVVKSNRNDQLSRLICDLIDHLTDGKLNLESSVDIFTNVKPHSTSKAVIQHKVNTPAVICPNSYSRLNLPYCNKNSYLLIDYTKKCVSERISANMIERHLGNSNYTRK